MSSITEKTILEEWSLMRQDAIFSPGDPALVNTDVSTAAHYDEENDWEFPELQTLFRRYNTEYFYDSLNSVEVRWSKKMTLSAGLCVYKNCGYCSIRLSDPLLKYRTIKELKETLLHEMIHAYLFVTHNKRDHSAHGLEFRKHMLRINYQGGFHITVFHHFNDEVNYYRTHIWRCSGVCQQQSPYFGYVRRSMNRSPGPSDFWWKQHQAQCGGAFIKVSSPSESNIKSGKRNVKQKRTSTLDVYFSPYSKSRKQFRASKSKINEKSIATKASLGNWKDFLKSNKSESLRQEDDTHANIIDLTLSTDKEEEDPEEISDDDLAPL